MSIRPLLRMVRIVGNHFRDDAAKRVHNAMAKGDPVFLELEPTNEHDPFAVKVLAGKTHVGYLPRDVSAIIHTSGVDDVVAEVVNVAVSKGGKSAAPGTNVFIDVGLNVPDGV